MPRRLRFVTSRTEWVVAIIVWTLDSCGKAPTRFRSPLDQVVLRRAAIRGLSHGSCAPDYSRSYV